jgi:hypothetical protein
VIARTSGPNERESNEMAQFRSTTPETGDVEHFESQNLTTAIDDVKIWLQQASDWRKSWKIVVSVRSRDTATLSVKSSSGAELFSVKIGRISSSRRVAA